MQRRKGAREGGESEGDVGLPGTRGEGEGREVAEVRV